MRFSIIVPVYNVESYLKKCIDSLINQTNKDYELILVDDGSVDSSGEICDDYAGKYDFVRVIHKKNEGLAATWMHDGLDVAHGDYVGSIDSDDWVDLNLLDKITEVIDKDNPEIIVYGYKNVSAEGEKDNIITARDGYYNTEQIEDEIIPRLINVGGFQNRNCIYLSRVNKFIKRELLVRNKQYYDSRFSFGEDNFWTIPNVLLANSLYVFSDWYPYSYRINPSSTTHSYNEGLWNKFCGLAQAEISILKAFDKGELISQVYNDMVLHAAISINNVMRGGIRGATAIREIKKIVGNEDLQRGLKNTQRCMCSKTEWINVCLMKMKAAHLIYFAKRIQYIFQ